MQQIIATPKSAKLHGAFLLVLCPISLALALFRIDGSSPRWWQGLLFWSFLCYFGFRVARLAVFGSGDAIFVRNTYRTTRIPLADIERVELDDATRKVTISRRDLRPVRIDATSSRGPRIFRYMTPEEASASVDAIRNAVVRTRPSGQ